MRFVLTLQIHFIERDFVLITISPRDDCLIVARLYHGLLSQIIVERRRDHEREHEEHAKQDQENPLVLAKFFKHRSVFWWKAGKCGMDVPLTDDVGLPV